ncbi:MAG: O-antigen ligase family protein [Kiritimatiellae bacterium]|nr:O-antigen ligase family protein [Kiritimatiellia bacterium]
MNIWAYICLCASAFSVPFSLPAGRCFLVLSMIFLIIDLVMERKRPVVPPVAWAGFVLVAVLVFVTVFGPCVDADLVKLRKLLWFLGIPVTAGIIDSQKRLSGLLCSFGVGTGVLALERSLLYPLKAIGAVNRGEATNFWDEIVRIGSMTDGQMLMLGIIISLGFLLVVHSSGRNRVLLLSLLVLQCVGFVINLKRGSWFAGGLAVLILLCVKKKWKSLMIMGVVVLSMLILPPVRARLGSLSKEVKGKGGERLAMWTKVAPSLMKKYPYGVGYRTLTYRMISRRAPGFISPDRDHLHSNMVQLLVAGGWVGLCAYLIWMCRAFGDGLKFLSSSWSSSEHENMNALILLLMLLALFLNGLVEYNFGDGELVLVYGFIMGAAAAGAGSLRQATRTRSSRLMTVLQ